MAEKNVVYSKAFQEGRLQGMRSGLLRQMAQRFGWISMEDRRRLRQIRSERRLLQLADKILTARSLREMGL